MNSRILCIGALVLMSAATWAQAPAQLKNLTAAYELQRSALKNTFENQVKAARDRYLATLSTAQKAAMAATRTADLAAIGAEIEAINSGALPENAPPDLPRALLPDRRVAAMALGNATRTIIPRQRELAVTFHRSLVALEESARKANDTALIEAIAAEKQRALGEVENAGGGQKNRNLVENGDFSKGPDGSMPPGWAKMHDWKEVSDATVVSEGREKFLRFRRLQAIQQANLRPEKIMPIPAKARYAEVTFRMRVEGLVKGKEYDPWPGVHLSAKDARDESLAKEEAVMKADSGWKKLTARLQIPNGAKSLSMGMGPYGAAGIVDFDDIVLEFK
jgi:hypothetical protein